MASTLIFSWGNPSRGDDAIGPFISDRLIQLKLADIDILSDFQLQIEHVIDIENRHRVLFIDASVSAKAPFDFYRLNAQRDDSYTSHAMSPQSLLAVYEQVNQSLAPPSFMLSIRACQFELGSSISDQTMPYIEAAIHFVQAELLKSDTPHWDVLSQQIKQSIKANGPDNEHLNQTGIFSA